MRSPVKISKDLRVVAPANAPPLSGSQAIELGKELLKRGCIAVALEVVDRPPRAPRQRAEVH